MSSLAGEERRKWLLNELRTTQAIALGPAAEALGVSEMTVRRDLIALERQGVARRVRGGAVHEGPVSFEGREKSHTEEKRLIAEKLLPLVPDSGMIALDSSTTMHRLARSLTAKEDLTVITNGLITFQVLQERAGVTAILTGGAADRRSDSLVGPVATATLENLRVSTFFTSAAAVDEHASYEDTLEEAEVKRAFARSASRVVIGAHAEKLGRNATAAAMKMPQVDALATELNPQHSDLSAYHGNDIHIL